MENPHDIDMETLLSIVDLKENTNLTWDEIGERVDISGNAARKRYYRYTERTGRTNDSGDGVWRKQSSPNEIEITSKSRRVKTLDELIEECKIDLDEWIIEWHEINKWEVGMKHKEMDMTYDEGVGTGHIYQSGEPLVEPLWQIKIKLKRKHPEAIIPLIVPMDIKPYKRLKKKQVDGDALQRALVFGDAHIGFRKDGEYLTPFHNRQCLSIVLAIAELDDFDIIVNLGDFLDLADWSDHFIRKPEFQQTTQAAVVEATWFNRQLRNSQRTAEMYLIEGNHELRMNTMLMKYIPAAYGLKPADFIEGPALLSIENLLSLEKMMIEYVGDYPRGEVWLNEYIQCSHGEKFSASGGATATGLAKSAPITMIYGHTHNLELAQRTLHTMTGQQTVTTFSPGCTCRIDGLVPGKMAKPNWQQGTSVVEYDRHGFVSITPIPIQNGVASYLGNMIEATDYIKQLEDETGYSFEK